MHITHHSLAAAAVRAIVATVATFIAAATAHARLGETPEECMARYGAPIKADPAAPGPNTVWVFRGVYIAAAFLADPAGQLRVSAISYMRQDPATGQPQDLPAAEITALLQINGADTWPETPGAGSGAATSWTSPEGSIARYVGKLLVISTRAQLDAYERTPQQARETTLSGF